MKDFLANAVAVIGIVVCVVGIVGAVAAFFLYIPWVIAYSVVQTENARSWVCEKKGGELMWDTYESGNYYTTCAPKFRN